IAHGISSIIPSFIYSEWFEPNGVKRLNLLEDLSGCNAVNGELFPHAGGLINPDWDNNWYLRASSNVSDPSRKLTSSPMLVVQGTGDRAVPADAVSKAVSETCVLFPKSQIRYALLEGAAHVPVLNTVQLIWLQWIEDRFMG
ncbi:uncharacterized protein CC84DRAFT_1048095, partial [Paraphaeosphaeria sporulosa]